MDDEIETLLANFTRELDYFVFTRDHLEPLMHELLAACERFLDDSGDDSGDDAARSEARSLRGLYVERMEGIGPMLQEWLRIRGTGERLWEAEHAMSGAQFDRFQALLDRQLEVSFGREAFDQLQDQLRRRLLMLEEMTP